MRLYKQARGDLFIVFDDAPQQQIQYSFHVFIQ